MLHYLFLIKFIESIITLIKDFTKFNELEPNKLKKIALILNDIYGSVDIAMRALMAVDDTLETDNAKKYMEYLA